MREQPVETGNLNRHGRSYRTKSHKPPKAKAVPSFSKINSVRICASGAAATCIRRIRQNDETRNIIQRPPPPLHVNPLSPFLKPSKQPVRTTTRKRERESALSAATMRGPLQRIIIIIRSSSSSRIMALLVLLVLALSWTGAEADLLECSTSCESRHCADPVLLRYGRYCGVLYTGCHNEKPCDALDQCCMIHDLCIGSAHDYLSVTCNRALLQCISSPAVARSLAFSGSSCAVSTVVRGISFAIRLGIWIGHGHALNQSSVSATSAIASSP